MSDETGKFLDPAQYWEWRFYLSEKLRADRMYEIEKLKLQRKTDEIQIAKLNMAIFQLTQVNNAKSAARQMESAYNVKKEALEQSVGMLLDECAIDDVTFEVRKLPKVGEEI